MPASAEAPAATCSRRDAALGESVLSASQSYGGCREERSFRSLEMKKFFIVIGVCPGKGKPVWSLATKAKNLKQLRGAVEKKLQNPICGSLWCPGPVPVVPGAGGCDSWSPCGHLGWKFMLEIKDDAAVCRLNDGDMLVVEGYIIEGYTIVESWEPPKDDGTRWIVEGIDETSWVKNVPPSFVRQLNSEGLFGKERPTALEVAGVRLSWADAELQRYFTTTCNEQTRRMVLDFFTETQVDQSNCFFVDQTGAGELRLIDAATGDVERELPGDDTKINISQPRCVSFKPTGDATFASQIDYEWLIPFIRVDHEWLIPFIRGADSSDGRTVVLPH